MASNLNRIFVYVPNAEVASFKTGDGLSASYSGKIAFLGGTGEIMTRGEVFAINKDADLDALKDLIGASADNLETKLGFEANTVVDAIKAVYEMADSRLDSAEEKLAVIQGDESTEGSIAKAASDTVAKILDSAPEAFDTLREIANWIANDPAGVTSLVDKVSELENQVHENEQVTALGLIDLQKQIDDMTGGAGSIQSQITSNLETLDGVVTLSGNTSSQPDEITIETSVDVLGSITVAEVDGIIKQDQSSKLVLKADAAGAAKKAYDTLYGTDADTIDSLTMKGIKARTDYKTRTGSLSVGSAASNESLNYDTSTGELATVKGVADAINGIEMWETYSAS